MNLEQLMALRNAKNDEMRNIITGAEENGNISEANATRYDDLEKEFDDLTRQIDRLEKQQQRDIEMNKPTAKSLRTGGSKGEVADDKDYKEAFIRMISNKATRNDMDMLEARAVQVAGDGSQGGFLVPDDFQSKILEKLDEVSTLREHSTVIRTTSEKLIPIGADTPEFGWIDELGDYPEGDLSFGQIKLGAHKTGGIILASREVLADSSIDIENYIINKMVKV